MLTTDFRSLVLTLEECVSFRNAARVAEEKITLTNGCFDILHPGHLAYLQASASLGHKLIVAVNSDESVRLLKGPGRPVNNERQRAEALAALRFVDAVIVFPGPRLAGEIQAIAPDFYTKAGDYTVQTLDPSERNALESAGTRIHFMPFLNGHSTTSLISSLNLREAATADRLSFSATLEQLELVLTQSRSMAACVEQVAREIVQCLQNGGKLLTCGNGGSAADALHLAEELVGRYRLDRRALPAICLNADPTALTCIANDYGYSHVFSRAVAAYGNPGDVLVGFTTSGNSQNVIEAFRAANDRGLTTILVSGNTGGSAKGTCTREIIVPSSDTARIQEVHTVVLHQWLEFIDKEFVNT
jgi:phosphoheptose isomerase